MAETNSFLWQTTSDSGRFAHVQDTGWEQVVSPTGAWRWQQICYHSNLQTAVQPYSHRALLPAWPCCWLLKQNTSKSSQWEFKLFIFIYLDWRFHASVRSQALRWQFFRNINGIQKVFILYISVTWKHFPLCRVPPAQCFLNQSFHI